MATVREIRWPRWRAKHCWEHAFTNIKRTCREMCIGSNEEPISISRENDFYQFIYISIYVYITSNTAPNKRGKVWIYLMAYRKPPKGRKRKAKRRGSSDQAHEFWICKCLDVPFLRNLPLWQGPQKNLDRSEGYSFTYMLHWLQNRK